MEGISIIEKPNPSECSRKYPLPIVHPRYLDVIREEGNDDNNWNNLVQ